MPTIDLSNNQSSKKSDDKTSSTHQASNNIQQNDNSVRQSPPPIQNNNFNNSNNPNNNWNDPWASPWDQPMGGGMGGNQGNNKRMSPQERVTMIESCYSEILGRKPDTRDINYYKYSTLTEEEIKKQLITGNEHKQLLQDGRDYKKLKDRTTQAETRVKILEGQILDQVEEFKELTNLLREKNRYIQELRERINREQGINPFHIEKDNTNEVSIKTISEIPEQTHFVNNNSQPTPKSISNDNFIERLIKAFSRLF